MRSDFAVFILSHGRANHVKTTKTLRTAGYTGKYYLIIDDEDNQKDDYIKNFGKNNVIIFNKKEASKKFDVMDNFEGKEVPTYARNMLYDIGKKLKLTYFLEFEDDYTDLRYRNEITNKKIKSFDKVIDEFIEFLDIRKDINTIAFLQGGDLLGGLNHSYRQLLLRKAMNSFFCRVDRPFRFEGRFNDDVNSYIHYGKLGKLYFSYSKCQLIQSSTQENKGGITESYKKYGTYVKSFYSVMLEPSCVKIRTLQSANPRIHHSIIWKNAVPKIISEKWRKK